MFSWAATQLLKLGLGEAQVWSLSHSPAIFPLARAGHLHQLRTGTSEHLLQEPDPQVIPAPSPPPLSTLPVSSVQVSMSGAGAARPQSWAGCHPRNRGTMVSLHGKQLMAQRTTLSRLSTDQPGAQLSEPVRISRIQLERANLVKRSETQQPQMAYVICRPLPARATFTHAPVS